MANISVNKKGYAFLKKYCESKNHYIDLNDYNSYYNFINDAISNFKFDEYAVEVENAKLSDLSYIINLLDESNQKVGKHEGSPSDQDSADFAKQEKSDESGQNDDLTPVSYGDYDLPDAAKQQDSREIFDSDIDDSDYAAKICELLVHQDLTHEAIFSELHPDVLLDLEIRLEYEQEFSEMIYKLMQKAFITRIESDDGISYYHLNDDLKKRLH